MDPSKGIAIVGLGGCFPDAQTVEQFWDNICRGHSAIGEVPADRWDSKLWYSTDRSRPVGTYSRIGGFIRYTRFNPKNFRIPPKTLEQVDEIQKLSLTAVADALQNAGYEVFPGSGVGRPFNRENTAVILGNAMGGENEDRTSLRCWLPEISAAMAHSAKVNNLSEQTQKALLDGFEAHYRTFLPTINEDSMPGELSNCITGRIANCFDLRGPNFTTDAACAASMAAMQAGVRGLLNHEFDVALVGGADRSMDPPTYVKFAKIGALSGDISAPFDARASGFVMGEGVGILVMRRLEDAQKDGDTIYAVVRGVGAASDGKGKGITAPNPRGQRLAVQRAYAAAGVPISSVGLFEAHGTSTIVGDSTELQVLTELLRESGAAPHGVPIGSVKSMIGHLKSAAGSAAVIKTALALHHKTLPPSANFEKPPANSPLAEGYLAVNTKARPWDAPADGGPRRAGVSAFGFGGTNFHIVLEEYTGESNLSVQTPPSGSNGSIKHSNAASAVAKSEQPAAAPASAQLAQEITALFAEKTGYDLADLQPDHQMESDLGIDTVKQAEIMGIVRERYKLPKDESFRLSDTPTLQSIIDYVARCAAGDVAAPSAQAAPAPAANTDMPGGRAEVLVFGGANPAQLVHDAEAQLAQASSLQPMLQQRAQAGHAPARLAFLADDVAAARTKVQDAGKKRAKMLAAQGIFLSEGEPLADRGKIAFLFPGQGSQYLGMLKDLAAAYPVVADTFREADEILKPLLGDTLTHIIWAEASDANDLRLRETQNCQPAMLAADVAFLRLMQSHGINPTLVAGHSLGEYAAAVAAGVLNFADALYAVSARGREMAGVKVEDNGKMAVVAGDAEKVQGILNGMDGYIIAANKNCHTQTVIAGESAVVEKAVAHFSTLGIDAKLIPVSHAFHSRIVAPATVPLERVLQNLDVQSPKIPLSANVDASYYPSDRGEIIALMAKQLASPVEFIAQVECLYADGARIFVECGPRRAITGFVRNVLGTREHRALAANHHKKPGVEGFKELLAALASDGVAVQWDGQASAPSRPVQPAATGNAAAPAAQAAAPEPDADQVVVSGLSVMLPSADPVGGPSGNDDLFARLLRGENFIAPLHDSERYAILDRNVVRLDKAGGDFTPLREPGEVIQLAARMGDFDLSEVYGIDINLADALDDTGKLAIAAGIDALRDAGLPLVRRYRTTSTGNQLPDRWALPEPLSTRTGVIMASAFPGVDRLIEEVSRQAASAGARRSAQTLETFVDTWASKLSNPAEGQALRTAYESEAKALREEAALYTFSRKWLFRTLALGHAQLAQTISAQGPNTQINAACASGTQAMGIAQDWIQLGRCDRVVVVSVDNVTSATNLPWFAAGFLAAGAATVEADLSRAAVPFGAERNGMILGSGAAAFVLENDSELSARGITPIADVLATKFANSAFHGTRLNPEFISGFMEDIAQEVCQKTGYDRPTMAKRTFFMSHETYTPARGGSSAAEVTALRHTFGDSIRDLLVANTKGYTGHPMGASLEDAVALKGLQRQQLPAVANLHNVDPAFTDLHFASGGAIDADLAMRFGAGFGSQVALAVYRRRAREEARLHDPAAYSQWLQSLTGRSDAGLEVVQRTLRVAEKGGVPVWELGIASLQPTCGAQQVQAPAVQPGAQKKAPMAAAPRAVPSTSVESVLREITQLFAEHTGYDAADLAPEHALESDLGIDTVKQAEIFGVVRERFGFAREESFKLSEVQSLRAIADYVISRQGASGALPIAHPASEPQAQSVSAPASPAQPIVASADRDSVVRELTALFAEHTGYDAADLHPDHQLEADLGIDTVKQAEIFGLVRTKFAIPKDESFKLTNVQTLTAIADYVLSQHEAGTNAGPREITHAAADEQAQAPYAPAAALPMPKRAPVTVVAPPAPAGLNRTDVVKELTKLFAEHTGYDPADLHAEHQLEADLGIDTVKQAEIFGLVRAKFAMPKDESFKLSDVQTLTAIADYVLTQQHAGSNAGPREIAHPAAIDQQAQAPYAPAAVQAKVTAEATTSKTSLNRDDVVRTLTAMFAEHTGYDAADLHADHQLEADLGIDTVKQAEIFGLVRARFGMPKDENFKLSEVQTLTAIADYVLSTQSTPPEPPPPEPQKAALPVPAQDSAHNPAHGSFSARRVALVAAEVGATPTWSLQGQRVALVAATDAAREALRAELTSQGAQVYSPSQAQSSDLEAWLTSLGSNAAQAVVYAVPTLQSQDASALEATVGEVFTLARAFARARQTKMQHAAFLVVGRGGGAFGFSERSSQAYVMGALAGVVKSLAKEWPDSHCRIVDVDANADWTKAAQLATKAWTAASPLELAWRNNTWSTLRRRGPVTASPKPLAAHAVVVATGAARGVTYELVKALAARGPLKITIISRTAGVSPADSPLSGRSDAEQKDVARAAVTASGERVTPAAQKRWIERERVKLEIHQNLEALRALGSEVQLIACDVGDAAGLSKAMAEVRWHSGKVDLLIHGAGIEESKWIADKDLSAFTRTFSPKASAALRLYWALRPQRMVTMGSVAGRFGNGGQVDYAAANEMMAALARASSHSLLNIGWTAWADVGMAVRGSVRQVLEAAGVELIPARIGIAMGADLITSDMGGDVVVAGALGAFDASEAALGEETAAAVAAPLPKIFDRSAPLADGGMALVRRFDPHQDRGLDDHRIDGVPVLPGVIGVELMQQAASYMLGEPIACLRNVRFESPLKLFRDLAVDVHVEVRRDGDTAHLALASFFAGPGGKQMRRAHFSAQATRGDKLTDMGTPDRLEMAADPKIGRADVYRRYFHGPSFQVLSAVLTLGDNGANARPEGSRPAWLKSLTHQDFVSVPLLREAGFQTAGLWEMAEIGRMGLPAGIDALQVLGTPAPGTPLVIEARRRGSEATGSSFDVWVRGTDGTVYDVMQGYRTVTLRDLNPEERFEPSARARRPVPSTLIVTIDEVQRLIQDDLNAALERYLSPSERGRFNTLKLDKRRVEWLAARIAAKRLIRETWFGREGAIVPYNAITIQRDPLGAPEVEIVGEHTTLPRISMSHSDGVAAAFLCTSEIRPGIDVERIESRDKSFTENYFTAREQAQFKAAREPDRLITEAWAVKEAMLKALGLGARVDFRDVEAMSHDTGWQVTLRGEAEARCTEIGGGEPQVEVETRGERVVARVLLPITGAMQPISTDSQQSEVRS